jgi:hypothetical protein
MSPWIPLRKEPASSQRRRGAAVLALLVCWFVPLAAQATGYVMFPSLGVSDKPQSKVWYHDGSWWAAVNATDRIGIYELSGNTWTARDSVGPPAPPISMGGTTDALWDGTNVYIAAFDSVASRLYKYTYESLSRHYVPQAGFPVLIPMGIGAETITIAKDTSDRLWCTYETDLGTGNPLGTGVMNVRHTISSDTDWSAPDSIGGLALDDDISAVVAFGNKIGVLWSNQNDYAFYFRWRNDADPPNVWSATETVIEGVQIADDHINMTVDASGRVFAALKDQFNRILVARRNLDGTWTTNIDATYGRAATRPIVLVDDSESKLYLFYTRWPSGGHIGINYVEYRVANYNTLVFGLETIFIDSPTVSMNDIQSTKQRLSPGSLLALCNGSDGNAYWNGWGPISGIGGTGGGGPLPAPPNPPGQPTATTAVAPGGSLGVAAYTLEEGAGSTSADLSGLNHTLLLGAAGAGDNAEPEWTSGITGNGLRFNGINDYAQATDPGDLTLRGSFTVECWVYPMDEPAAMTLISKGATAARNYRLELTSGGGAEFSMKNTAGTTITATASSVFLFDAAWHHLAGVYDATALQLRLYVDGVLQATKPFTGTVTTSADPVLFGARQSTSGMSRYFFGVLDQMRISASAVYADNFSPPYAFTTRPTRYVKLAWGIPAAQGGIKGYNVFRSVNGSPFTMLNGTMLVSTNAYNDASAVDGFLTYKVTAVDLLGQESLGSPTLTLEFEGYDPLPPTVPQAYAVNRHVATGGLVAAYPLDEGSGQSVTDAGGNGYGGSLGASSAAESSDPLWRPGISGSSLEFDGTNDYATIPDAEGLRLPGSFTVAAWFKLNQTGILGGILGKGGSSQRNYRLMMLSSGKIEISFDNTSGTTYKLASSAAVTDLEWHHAAGVYDVDAGQMRVYVDGVLTGSRSASGTPRTGTDALWLGARKSSSSLKDWFKGRVDLVQIYSGPVFDENFTPPTTLGSTSGAGYVTLRWSLPELGLVRGYNVYRTLPGVGPDWLLNRTGLWTDTWYTDEKPHPGTNCYFVRAVNAHGVEGTPTQSVCVDFAPDEVPTDAGTPAARGLQLHVAPNPFNPTTRITFHLDRAGAAALALYDVSGRRVRSWKLAGLAAGQHTMPLHVEEGGRRLASGAYLLQLEASGRRERARLVVLK